MARIIKTAPRAAIGVIVAPKNKAELMKVNTTDAANINVAVKVETRAAASYQR